MFETATYEKLGKGKAVFSEGDPPNEKCYVILTGRCAVFRNATIYDVKLEDQSLKKFDDANTIHMTNALFAGEDKKLMRKLMYYGDLLAKISYGTLFGETGLLSDKKRNASIIALEDIELMVFHKSSLDLIKASYSNDIAEKRESIITLIPEVSKISNPLRIVQLLEYFKPKKAKKGDTITEEGKKSNIVYFLDDGELEITKIISMPKIVNNRSVAYVDTNTRISNIQGKGIVGEDCLEPDGKYKYTVVVKTPEAKLFTLEKNPAHTDLFSFPVFPILLKGYNLKE